MLLSTLFEPQKPDLEARNIFIWCKQLSEETKTQEPYNRIWLVEVSIDQMPCLVGFHFGSGSFYEVGECASCAMLQCLIYVMQNDWLNKTLRSHTINVSFYLNKSSLSLVHC